MKFTNYPLIAIVGQSGTGKSYSIKNLPIDRTRILNIERKPFPFKHGFNYGPNDIQCPDVSTFDQALDKALKDSSVDYIVIESMTKYFEMLLTFSKGMNKGYEIYTFYNDRIGMFLERIKSNQNKLVFCIAIDEVVKVLQPSGAEQAFKRIKVEGKKWEGVIEKEYAIVLYTEVKAEKGKPNDYRMLINTDGVCSAKSPPEMFGPSTIYSIPNDLQSIGNNVLNYYGLKTLSTLLKEEADNMAKSTVLLTTPIPPNK